MKIDVLDPPEIGYSWTRIIILRSVWHIHVHDFGGIRHLVCKMEPFSGIPASARNFKGCLEHTHCADLKGWCKQNLPENLATKRGRILNT